MKTNSLHDRLLLAAGHFTYAKLGGMTGVHPETVRRFMQGQTPKPEFLAEICRELGVNGDWLLTGRGQMWQGGAKGAKAAAAAAASAPAARTGKKAAKKAGKRAGKKTAKKVGKKAGKKAKKRAGRR